MRVESALLVGELAYNATAGDLIPGAGDVRPMKEKAGAKREELLIKRN